MSAQPANNDIKIFRTVRAQRDPKRHESVAALVKGLRSLVMAVPGMEVMAGVLSRDTSVADFSPYMGEARHNAGRGFPIVYGLKPTMSFAAAQQTLPDVDFAFYIGRDAFIQNTEAGLTGDLQGNLRALDTGY